MKKILIPLFCIFTLLLLSSCDNKQSIKTKQLFLNSINIEFNIYEDYTATLIEKNESIKNDIDIKMMFENKKIDNKIVISKYTLSIEDYLLKHNSFLTTNYIDYKDYMEKVNNLNDCFQNAKYTDGTYVINNKEKIYESICFEYNGLAYCIEFYGSEKCLKDLFSKMKAIPEINKEIVATTDKINLRETKYFVSEIDSGLYTTVPKDINDIRMLEYKLEKYLFFYNGNNQQVILLSSNYNFEKLNNNYWHFVNGIEIIEISDNKIIAHDINKNENYYLNTQYVFTKNSNYQKCIEIVYLDKHNQKEIVEFISKSTKFMTKKEYIVHSASLKQLRKGR